MFYCKDGSIYKGQFIGQDEYTYHIIVFTKDTLRLPKHMVTKMKTDKDYLLLDYGRTHETNGFFWSANLGFNAGGIFDDNEDHLSTHLEVLFGWRANKRWTLAGGFGSEFNSTLVSGFYVETQFTSMSIYGRYYITDTRRRLFAYSRVGYGFGPQEEDAETINHTGGFQWQGGGGIHFASK